MELLHSYLRFKMPDNAIESKGTGNLFWNIVAKTLAKIIPEGNPYLNKQIELVREWVVEFDENGLPVREIGLDAEGIAIVKLPWKYDYGYRTDNNLVKSDFYEAFKPRQIKKEEFDKYWNTVD